MHDYSVFKGRAVGGGNLPLAFLPLVPHRVFVDFIRAQFGYPEPPPGMTPEVATLYRATIFLAGGAYLLARVVAASEIDPQTQLARACQTAALLENGIVVVESQLRAAEWAWGALRRGHLCLFDGKYHATPLRAAVETARAALERLADGFLFIAARPAWAQDWQQLVLDQISERGMDGVAHFLASDFCRPEGGLWIPEPSLLIETARQDVAAMWLHSQERDPQPTAAKQTKKETETIAAFRPPTEGVVELVFRPTSNTLPSPAFPYVTLHEFDILCALQASHPVLLDAATLAVRIHRSRTAVADLLPSLEEARLIFRPRGERSGYGLTSLGVALMAQNRN